MTSARAESGTEEGDQPATEASRRPSSLQGSNVDPQVAVDHGGEMTERTAEPRHVLG